MRNLRQRFGGFIVAGILAAVSGPPHAGLCRDRQMGGNAKNTCAFVLGMLFKVPADSGAAAVFQALSIAYDCD
jgi:hypothetical protein